MNLQTIQKRVEELTSELLTISNDLAFLVSGDVQRQAVPGRQIRNFQELSIGDTITIDGMFNCINGGNNPAGTYVVLDVEESDYEGVWSVRISVNSGSTWINLNQIAMNRTVTKGA